MNTDITAQHMAFHARPVPMFSSPAFVYCHTFLRQSGVDTESERNHLSSVINHKQLTNKHCSQRLEVYVGLGVELRIETHHEFICYIWIFPDLVNEHTIELFVSDLPQDWLTGFPGRLLTQVLLSFEKSNKDEIPLKQLQRLFGSNQLIGNLVKKESARIWTDFYANTSESLLRVHVEDFSLGPRRSGRLAQYILELENYRSMAEIAFPRAEEIVYELEGKEIQLAKIIKQISLVAETDKQQKLLDQLLDMSVSSENWRSKTGHRFSATSAYKKIFEDRLEILDETMVLGYQPFSRFLTRTTMPTFRTCDAANDRLNVFITRIDRAISLLSTRIRATMEQQNNALLTSVDKQHKQQMILQETIEAFAIVAITYNCSALTNLFLESMKKQGLLVDTSFWTMLSVPTFLFIAYGVIRYLRNKKQRSS